MNGEILFWLDDFTAMIISFKYENGNISWEITGGYFFSGGVVDKENVITSMMQKLSKEDAENIFEIHKSELSDKEKIMLDYNIESEILLAADKKGE